MKKLYLFLFLGLFSALSSQNKISDTTNYLRNGIFENAKGKIITDNSERIQFQKERNRKIELEKSHLHKGTSTAVEMCTNGGFEQVENINGNNFIKNFLYNIGDPPGPTQCKSISNSGVNSIPQYSPTATNLMATSVPANLFDRYMGDIKAFDQYALKINYENSGTYGSIVQGQRFKTNNENFLKFNYKAILQSVYDDSHRDNQPFFKARIINKDKVVVSEFCLVGDEKNCIFTKVSDGGSWYVTLYTANWQSGILDISSIPNNEEFTVEFMASRCGLGGHFGYAYVDDICLLQSNENFVGSVTLDPLYAVCPTLPMTVCGNYTLPNSGGVTATLKKLTLKVYNENGQVVHTTTTTSSLDPVTKKFCFTLLPQDFPNISTSNYNVGVTADFDVGTSSGSGCGNSGNTQIFASASDPDANDGWDISFLNCSSGCSIQVNTAKIPKCDANHDGKEDFNLTDFNAKIVTSTSGFTFNYFKDYNSAFNNTGAITNFTLYNSPSAVIYVRVSQNAGCYKIIPVNLEVNNPTATISGILNVCSGSTELKASEGSIYSWSTGESTKNITVTSIGVYSVTVTDSSGCSSTASVNIEPSQTAVTPTLEITQPSCFVSSGTVKITSAASEYSFDNGLTWGTNPVKSNLYPGDYYIMIKTVKGCTSYAQMVTIKASLLPYPYYNVTQPKFCGDTGSITITSPATTYSYDNGVTWVNDSMIDNLDPGLYKIRTKDAAGCISNPEVVQISSVTLGRPDFTVINPACNVAGSITINTSADFYTFDGGQTWVTTNVLNNILTGNFSIGIKNSLGCTSYLESIYLQTFQAMYPDYDVIQPTCGENGTIYITTTADFYSFDNGATWTTSNTKDLPAGNYYIKLKNAAGCISRNNSVTLYEPRLSYPFISVVQPTCGVDGTITINTVSDFYSFDNGATWVTTNTKTLPFGYYQIKVKNSLGCMSDSQYVSLDQAKIETPNVSVVQPTCTTKGSITITTPSSFYSINEGQTWSASNVFNNLTGSNYSVMIKNSQNCISEMKYVYFNQIYLAEPTYTAVSPSCGNIGNITFTSTADFYSIDYGSTWSTNPVFNNLLEGDYYLIVKNSANCRSSGISVYFNKINLASPTVKVIQPACGTPGSITITSPGTSFSFNGGSTWGPSSVLNNLTSSYYQIMSRDATCTSTTTYVSIQQFYLPDPAFTVTNPTCGVGGTISITTPAAKYSINSGETWSTTPNFTNLAAGNYYIMVQNAAGCKSSTYNSSLSLQKYYLPKPNISIVQPTCTIKGSIKISTIAPEYSFDGGQTWSNVNEKLNLTSGLYNVVIRNAQGCTSDPYGMNIYMTAFLLPRPFVKTVQPSCGDGGSITIVSQAAFYSFDNGTTWVTSPSLLNPTPGYYSVLIKNSAGCISQSASASINRYYLTQPIVTTIQPTCSSPTGSIFINTIADLYSFDNGTTWTTNPVKTNLNSGSYNLLIKNAAGCISERAYVNIYSAPSIPPIPAFTVTQPTACDATDGKITITTPGKSFSFNNGASWSNSPIKQNIGAGTYILKIKTNSSTCESVSIPVTLDSGINIAAPAVLVTQPTCSVSTGSISVTTNAATYSFDDGLTFIYANTKNNLLPGVYKIKIKNAAGCISYAISATVTTPAPLPSPNSTVTQPNCSVALGSIKITTVAAEYSFDNGITYGPLDTKSNLSPGTYNLMIKDSAGCTSLVGLATINPQPITPSAPQISVTQSSGCTNSFGTVAIISAAAYYSFDDGATWVTNSSSNLSPGTYKIKIKMTASGCSSPSIIATIDPPANAPTLPLFTTNQPSSCINPYGTITITSTENQYSFDGGVSYSSSATSGSLAPGNYLLKVKNSAGCESGGVSVTIDIPVNTPKKPTANVIQIDCANAFAQITINENTAQYSIDDGLSWQNSNIFKGLLPNSYALKTKNNLGCISVSTVVVVNTFNNPTSKPLVNQTQSFCVQQNATVGNISATGTGLLWYSSAMATTPLALTSPLINGNTYFVTQTINSCESERALVKINIITTPSPTANPLQQFCISQAATISNLVVTGSQIKWYSSNSGNMILPNNTKLQDGFVYFASQTDQGCESVQRVPVTVSLVMTNIPATDFAAPALCSDENGTKKIDLTAYQPDVVANPQNYTYEFYDQNNNLISDFKNYKLETGQNTVFVKVNSSVGCSAKVTLTINLKASPIVNVPPSAEYCPENIIKLDAGNQPSSSSFTWIFNGKPFSNQQIVDLKESGSYQITVTNILGCTTSKTVVVKKVGLPIITDIKIENSTVQILATGIGILEYSIDNVNWQTSNLFYNVPTGNHIAYVRSGLQPCAMAARAFTIFNIVNVFSPDYDGINDEWKIEGIENYPGSKIKVIDRFGTLVLDRTVTGKFSWNGEYLSRKLPTGNYWYQIVLSDNRVLSGYVMIKNRN